MPALSDVSKQKLLEYNFSGSSLATNDFKEANYTTVVMSWMTSAHCTEIGLLDNFHCSRSAQILALQVSLIIITG